MLAAKRNDCRKKAQRTQKIKTEKRTARHQIFFASSAPFCGYSSSPVAAALANQTAE
jgi:hypothetical protein